MVRELKALNAKELPTTEGAAYPFWSPDNRYIGFFQTGKMKKIEITGGPAVTICDAPMARGGSWNQDDIIIFEPNWTDPLYQVSASGGKATEITTLDTVHHEITHRWPHFLPDGKHFLYYSRSSFGGVELEDDTLVVASLDGKVNKRLMPAKGNAAYASGYLIYLREKTLMAQPFDVGKLEVSGDAVPLAEPVEYDLIYNRTVFSVSQNGILIYQPSASQAGYQLAWFNRAGKMVGKILEPADYGYAALSPDGKKIAFDIYDYEIRNRDIWLYEIARGLKTRFTFDPSVDQWPVWMPDGSRILFHSDRRGPYNVFQKSTSGAGAEEILLESTQPKFAYDWSADGRFIAYSSTDNKTKLDLWIFPDAPGVTGGDRKPFLFLQTEFEEDIPKFSPDMHWISYVSNESGRWELYVRPFIGADGQLVKNQTGKWQVSTNGLSAYSYYNWNRNGKEIFYISIDNKLMAAEVKASGSTFEVGTVRPLFEIKGQIYYYDVTGDGQKFLMGIPIGGQTVPPLALVTNWCAGLKKK